MISELGSQILPGSNIDSELSVNNDSHKWLGDLQ